MKIHFIGIGGIGVSALAQYYLAKGHDISGSDLVASEITESLQKKGIQTFIGNSAKNISKDIDWVIYSPAVPKSNPELLQATHYKLQTKSYPEALGELTKQYTTIAVSGSHGKSTTTAMIGLLLKRAGIDPTVIVGTRLKEFGGSNFRMGQSKYLVIEACEYDSSFINYSPKIIVVTNVDKEHLDYFKTFKNVIKTFKEFIERLPRDGVLVFNKDDKHISIAKNHTFALAGYSIKSRSRSDRAPIKSRVLDEIGRSSIISGQKEANQIKKILKIPGNHNVYNALAALSVARVLGVNDKVSLKSLSEYKGSWRRFETKEAKVNGKKITVVSDYGHHPNEVAATLKAAREKYLYPPKFSKRKLRRARKKIWCIFQPHQYQRTYYLFNDFVAMFKRAPIDNIIITDIYDVAGREEKKISSTVSSENLVKKINKKNIQYMSLDSAENFVKKNIKSGEVIIIMGAGDIYKLFDKF